MTGQRHTPAGFPMPAGACDCHMHVFGPDDRYPYTAQRSYTPRPASLDEYLDVAKTVGLERVVFVQPSAYGTDNRRMLDAIAAVGPAARGIAGIDAATTDAEIAAMAAGGMRGVRFNAASLGLRDARAIAPALRETAARIAPHGWHLQIFIDLAVIAQLADLLPTLPVPVVIDHMGHAHAELGPAQPGFDQVLKIMASGNVWVKLSGAYRVSRIEPDFPDAEALARALVAANPDRCVWGTDWPHTGSHAGKPGADPPLINYRPFDDGHLLRLLAKWVDGDPGLLRRILTDNPAALYGF